MRRAKWLGIGLAVACLCVGAVRAAQPRDVTEAVKVVDDFSAAWDRGDLDGLMALCTDDFQYVNASAGLWWKTKAEARQGWKVVQSFGIVKLKLVERATRRLGADVLLVTEVVDAYPPAPPGADVKPFGQAIGTVLLVRQHGRWLIASSQMTPVQPRGAP